jgi:cytochrome P450
VVFSQYMTHHLPELFPQPERFAPERWRHLNPSPYAYLPFAAGPRMCLGGPLALLTIKISLAVILQTRHFRVTPDAAIDGKVISTMLTPATTMPMMITDTAAPFSFARVTGNIHDMVELSADQ